MSTTSNREEALFTAVLLRPAHERRAFLASACGGDAALHARIEALLAAHETPESLTSPPTLASHPATSEEQPGDWIGRYRLLQKIGEGGCGIVYMAEQEEPVRRRVALKVIKLGMDTKAVIARFEAERQALALIDHPNISKVLDGGATATGRPFFVMELVRGVPITKFCDDQGLDLAARLELFIRVCSAVQHAHQKGVIHRDLKPSNILVTLAETGATPKVIDFGIAKATQGRLTDATLVTAFDQFIGTPAYMSPEQAAFTNLDIDTRSDVYSLGILLYELLAGRLPFDSKSFSHSSREEIRRLICEIEPPRPSKRFATLDAADRAKVARRRATDPARLASTLSGDLDWIVMRALEKNRVRRYETPTALAADLTHHLKHEAVAARPPTTAYRLGKLVRRNRLTFAAAAAVACALVTGSIISTWQAVRARRAEHLADAERRRAVGERARADELLDFMLSDLRAPLAKVGQLNVLDAVAAKSMAYFASFDPHEMDHPTLARHVSALTQLGQLRMDQARYAEAETAYAEAHARAVMLAERRPGNREDLYARGQAEYGNGFVQLRRGDLPAARVWFLRYRDTAALLVALDPNELRWQREIRYGENNLAVVEYELGNPEAARAHFLAELATLQRLLTALPNDLAIRSSIANATSYLGSIAEAGGNLIEAAQRFTEQVEQFEAIGRADPENPHWRFKLADSLSFQAGVHAIVGQREPAARALARAHGLLETLIAQDATNGRWQNALVVVHLRDAMVAQATHEPARAAPLIAAALAEADKLTAQEPTDLRFPYRLAMALRLEAELQLTAGSNDAVRTAARAAEVGEFLLKQKGAANVHRAERANAAIVAGRIAAMRGDIALARSHWQWAHTLLSPLVAESKDWRVLDPAARAAALLGRAGDAQVLISRLDRCGYIPLEPWPAATANLPVRTETNSPK